MDSSEGCIELSYLSKKVLGGRGAMSSGSELRVHKLLNLLKLYQVNVTSVFRRELLDKRFVITNPYTVRSLNGCVRK